MKTITLLTAASLFGAPAFAGGLNEPIQEPTVAAYQAPAPVNSGGDWTGPYVGLQLGYGDLNSNTTGVDGNGIIGGVHAGYRYDFGKFVAGGQFDYDRTNIDLGARSTKLDNVIRLKAIGGVDLGRTLVYVTAGAAYADATIGRTSLSDNGYFGGIGLDYAVSERVTIGAEYLHHRFNDFDGTGIDLTANTIEAKVSLKF